MSCVRIKGLDDVPLNVVGQTIAETKLDRFLDRYLDAFGSSRTTRVRSG